MIGGMQGWISVAAQVELGYGVASGRANDPRFPQGTLALQRPIFAELGLDLSPYFLGTLNLSIAPHRYKIRQAKYTFRQIQWSPVAPAEDFSFFDCRLRFGSQLPLNGLIYYPHPETKPEHFQSPTTLEVIALWINDLQAGDSVQLEVDPQQISFDQVG